ncbi:sn-glycerol-3-phosphate transport system permease protein UgpE [Roseobacter cerasinus]|uniref:sn-glycerol-3-phosphate transport system permease protein UgpE n=1 Tax=Roseobacter cerasinus TaxID=2602289 RepID=A0A640VWM5_9RHOB|nr:ABC transporter permease subunit [Roseobacter cerasinus]GFE52543.1 sn-glycerol-3-phosphate transport system permease protein UgpE [Roseobacter cerasinus]
MADITESRIAAQSTAHPAKRIKWEAVGDHAILIAGALLMLVPVYMIFASSSWNDITLHREGLQFGFSDDMANNYNAALFEYGGFTDSVNGVTMLANSLILGIGFAIGKIIVGMMAAYAIVYFRLRFATLAFWMIFTTLLLPLEVRILPSYEVITWMNLGNTYTGLIVPLIASATATFFFRQFFMSVPEELIEAARIDGAGPVKFFIDILVPLSQTMIAAMFIIMFVFGWNQYLWPTLITTDESLFTLVRGIRQIMQAYSDGSTTPEYGEAAALAIIAMTPPVLVVVFFQSWFVKGLTESDK